MRGVSSGGSKTFSEDGSPGSASKPEKQGRQGYLHMPINFKNLGRLCRGCGEHKNHLIDGFLAGRVSRREFIDALAVAAGMR
jgi:hypothetical protein